MIVIFCNIHNAHTQTAHEYISNMDLSTKIMYIALKQFLLQTFVVADKYIDTFIKSL